jgi:hypothetical protein
MSAKVETEIKKVDINDSKQIINLPLNKITINDKKNIRDQIEYDPMSPLLNAFALDLIHTGLLQPISVVETKEGHKLLIGWLRYHAHKLIQDQEQIIIGNEAYPIFEEYKKRFATIDCILVDEPKNDEDRELLQFSENLNRNSLSNIYLSKTLNKYKDKKKQIEIAKLLDKSEGQISEISSISKLNPEIEKLILEIDTFGMSKSKYNETFIKNEKEKKAEFGTTKFAKFKVNKVGIRPLYNIASSKNQVLEFYETFKGKCSDDDWKSLETTKAQLLELSEKTKIKRENTFRNLWKEYLSSKNKDDKNGEVNAAKKLVKALNDEYNLVESLELDIIEKPAPEKKASKKVKSEKTKKDKENKPKSESKKKAVYKK